MNHKTRDNDLENRIGARVSQTPKYPPLPPPQQKHHPISPSSVLCVFACVNGENGIRKPQRYHTTPLFAPVWYAIAAGGYSPFIHGARQARRTPQRAQLHKRTKTCTSFFIMYICACVVHALPAGWLIHFRTRSPGTHFAQWGRQSARCGPFTSEKGELHGRDAVSRAKQENLLRPFETILISALWD